MTTILLDANNVIVRNIMASALDDLKAGEVWTGGVYGTLNQLPSLLRRACSGTPNNVVAFFDAGIPPNRLEMISEFKAERKKQRELLTDEQREKAFGQLATTRTLFELLGITCASYKDREADDCIAAAVQVLVRRGESVVVVSTDGDLLQTVEYGATVYNQSKDVHVTGDNFESVMGVPLYAYVVFKALVGDPSDGIKGAAGCGKVRAAEVIGCVGAKAGSPVEFLSLLAECLKIEASKRKLRKYEQSILEDYVRLERVCRGIDLRDSFGGTTALAAKLDARPRVQKKAFLSACARLKMSRVLGNPDYFVGPFERMRGLK